MSFRDRLVTPGETLDKPLIEQTKDELFESLKEEDKVAMKKLFDEQLSAIRDKKEVLKAQMAYSSVKLVNITSA
jgi:hypothetical protein